MSFLTPTITTSRKTVTVASVQFTLTLADKQLYVLTSTVACYVLQGANPTASAADGSTLVGANVPTVIYGTLGAKLAIIRATVDGEATLSAAIMVP